MLTDAHSSTGLGVTRNCRQIRPDNLRHCAPEGRVECSFFANTRRAGAIVAARHNTLPRSSRSVYYHHRTRYMSPTPIVRLVAAWCDLLRTQKIIRRITQLKNRHASPTRRQGPVRPQWSLWADSRTMVTQDPLFSKNLRIRNTLGTLLNWVKSVCQLRVCLTPYTRWYNRLSNRLDN
jgi:hypothetical protein